MISCPSYGSAGKDATNDFEDVGHSKLAKDMLKDLYIGEIDVSTIPKNLEYVASKKPEYNQSKSSQFFLKILQILIPLAILGLALTMSYLAKTS